MCRITDNLHRMTRVEINNLAKNRFLSDEIQMYIADHSHIQAKYYLADNESLCSDVANKLWDGRSIVLKSLLIASGNIRDVERIRFLYDKYVNGPGGIRGHGKGIWRFRSTFLRNPWYYSRHRNGDRYPNTPSDILLDIYQRTKAQLAKKNQNYDYYYTTSSVRSQYMDILSHPNVDLKTAIIMSTDLDPQIAKAGLAKMAELST